MSSVVVPIESDLNRIEPTSINEVRGERRRMHDKTVSKSVYVADFSICEQIIIFLSWKCIRPAWTKCMVSATPTIPSGDVCVSHSLVAVAGMRSGPFSVNVCMLHWYIAVRRRIAGIET